MFKGKVRLYLIVGLTLVNVDVIEGQHLPPVKVSNAGGVKRIRSMSLSSGRPLSTSSHRKNVNYIKGKDGNVIVAASTEKKRKQDSTDSWGWHRDAVFKPFD